MMFICFERLKFAADCMQGDVALSVLMTTSTTIGTIFMTPLIAKVVLGTLVPVDAMGIVMSTIQVRIACIVCCTSPMFHADEECFDLLV